MTITTPDARPSTPAPEPPSATPATNPLAVAGLTLALFSLALNYMAIPSLLAVLLGTLGVWRANTLHPTGAWNSNKRAAVAAIAIGLVCLLFAGVEIQGTTD